ncbi:hypothetical protein FRC03_009832 [Tulasnella sp. 419]|nr:hypothetical protein FRC03_009832 [Tulasnella sp. 419]
MDLLLAYRALCLFRMNRKLLWINVVAFVLCATSTVALFSISVPKYQNIPTPEFLTGCWSILPSYDFAALIPGLLYELWLFALVVYKVITYVRNYGTKHMQGVFRLLVKDSSIWFFIVAGGILWNLLGMAFAPRGLKGIALPIFRNIVIICGCRMVLHLRKAYFVHANLTLTPGRSSTAYEPGDRTFGGTPRHPEESAEERAKKAIEFAQKIGLPPITKDELGSWDEEDAKLAENGQGRGSSRPHSSHSAKRSNGLKSKKPRRRDLEEGDDTDLRQVDVKGSDSQDCFEMVRVRVDVESHAVVEEAGGIGALTPRERRVRLAAGGGGTESSRLEMMRAMGQVEDDDDESDCIGLMLSA